MGGSGKEQEAAGIFFIRFLSGRFKSSFADPIKAKEANTNTASGATGNHLV